MKLQQEQVINLMVGLVVDMILAEEQM